MKGQVRLQSLQIKGGSGRVSGRQKGRSLERGEKGALESQGDALEREIRQLGEPVDLRHVLVGLARIRRERRRRGRRRGRGGRRRYHYEPPLFLFLLLLPLFLFLLLLLLLHPPPSFESSRISLWNARLPCVAGIIGKAIGDS